MASYLDTITGYGGRSYNTLVVSEGDMPAEAFLPSSSEGVKFEFQFGPEGNQNVVIPKGKILAAATPEYDPLTETYRPTVKICTAGETPIGVAPYNVYETRYMVESENTISPITRNYIQVPLFSGVAEGITMVKNGQESTITTAAEIAASIGFGAAWTNDAPESIVGKYVVSDENGNYQVIENTNENPADMSLVIGQVLAVETNIPPAGFLQYCLELGNADYTAFIQKTREVLGIANNASNRQANKAFADMAKFAVGMGSYAAKGQFAKDYLVQLRGGIRFLTDSYFKTRERKTFEADNWGKAVVMAGENSGLEVAEGNVLTYTAEKQEAHTPVIAVKFDKRDEALSQAINLLNNANGEATQLGDYPELQNIVPKAIEVTVNGTKISEKYIKTDYVNNMIYVYLVEPKLTDGTVTVEVDADIITRKEVGLPTYMDFKGCVGMAKILLNK